MVTTVLQHRGNRVADFRAKTMDLGEWAAFKLAYELVFQMLGSAKDAALFREDRPGGNECMVLIPSYRATVVESISPGGWHDMEDIGGHDWQLVVGHADAPGALGVPLGRRG
jgi:hypothetical protein